MKKLSFALAMILVCGALAACGGNSDGTTAPKGSSNPPKQSESAKTTQKPVNTTKPGTTKPAETTKQPEKEDKPKDELIDGSKFKVDGDLSDWEGLATIKLQGEADTANKSVTYYGVMTDKGLYLACDVYHDIYLSGQASWIANTYLAVCIGNSSERYNIYATGLDSGGALQADASATYQITESIMKTDEINDATKYHTVFEVFIATESLPEYSVFQNTVSMAMGYRTPGDMITGSAYAGANGYSDSWSPVGFKVADCAMIATPKGLYGFEEYFAETE